MKKGLMIFLFICIILGIIFFPRNNNISNITNNIDSTNNNTVVNIVTNNVVNQNVVQNKQDISMENKTVLCIGDSLIRGYGNDDRGIDYYLSEIFPEATFINNSKSGSTITLNTGNDEIVIKNQLNNINQTPDIVLFNGGANDVIGYALGFLDNNKKKEIGNFDNLSENTVMYDFEATVKEIKNKFPNAKLCYINLIGLNDETISRFTSNNELANEIKTRKKEFSTEIKKVFDKYNIDYIDLSSEIENNNYRQEDFLHINEDGYKVIASKIAEKFK